MIPTELLHCLIGLVLAMILQRLGLPPFQGSKPLPVSPRDLNTEVREALFRLLREVMVEDSASRKMSSDPPKP